MCLSLHWQIGTTSSCRIPQVLTEARVGGRSGEILGLPFFVSFADKMLLPFGFLLLSLLLRVIVFQTKSVSLS
jgi:transaldolase